MNKRYSITGHTSGIGKALYEKLLPDAIGFSRSNGYDINNYYDRQRIINESEGVDVFINNAYNGFGQTYLFIDLFKEWKNKNKTIINIGSNITNLILPETRYDLLYYQTQKISLKNISYMLKGNCNVIYKSFGYVGTDTILKKYPHFTEKDYISVDQAVDIILS